MANRVMDVKIGNVLSKFRNENGLSQQTVADLAGVSKATICLWESGKRSINMSDFIHLVEVANYDKKRTLKEVPGIF